jgi:hypothetical protein
MRSNATRAVARTSLGRKAKPLLSWRFQFFRRELRSSNIDIPDAQMSLL